MPYFPTNELVVRALARAGLDANRRPLRGTRKTKKQPHQLDMARARIAALKARGVPGFEDVLAAARRRNAARAAR